MDCVNRLRAQVSPTKDRKTLLFPSYHWPVHASFLVGSMHGNLDSSGCDILSVNTNIRHETICILMVRAGTLLVSGQKQ